MKNHISPSIQFCPEEPKTFDRSAFASAVMTFLRRAAAQEAEERCRERERMEGMVGGGTMVAKVRKYSK